MPANYIIENHEELLSIGRRTHAQIDSDLDAMMSASNWPTFTHNFVASDLVNEVSPAIVRIPLATGQSLVGAVVLFGSIDGRALPPGQGWRPSADGLAIEIYIPVDPKERSIYLLASPLYSVTWQI